MPMFNPEHAETCNRILMSLMNLPSQDMTVENPESIDRWKNSLCSAVEQKSDVKKLSCITEIKADPDLYFSIICLMRADRNQNLFFLPLFGEIKDDEIQLKNEFFLDQLSSIPSLNFESGCIRTDSEMSELRQLMECKEGMLKSYQEEVLKLPTEQKAYAQDVFCKQMALFLLMEITPLASLLRTDFAKHFAKNEYNPAGEDVVEAVICAVYLNMVEMYLNHQIQSAPAAAVEPVFIHEPLFSKPAVDAEAAATATAVDNNFHP